MSAASKLAEYFRDKKVLILGFGREGKSTYGFIRKYFPEKVIGISDKNPVTIDDKNTKIYSGENYLDAMAEYDLVMKSPGIAFTDVTVPDGVTIACQTDLFVRFCDCRTVGITGTKGKTTTSTLIYKMLRAAGFKASVIGNIGIPVFENIDMAEDEIAVIEMSSHQLEFTHSSPSVAVFTNIYEEHLDHYRDGFKGYVSAKLNIVKHQTENDVFVCNGDQDLSPYIDFSAVKSKKIFVTVKPDDEFAALDDLNPHLLGRHNSLDIRLAAAAAKTFGVGYDKIRETVENYEGIEHRMEFVGTYDGVEYYNDSIATIPLACICAVEALKRVDTLIIGGMDRGLDLSGFAKDLNRLNINNIICMPVTGHNVGKMLEALGTKSHLEYVDDMVSAVDFAKKNTGKGKICLLSPAAASYNVYKNFEEKGSHYKKLVRGEV